MNNESNSLAALPADALYRRCDPAGLAFEDTSKLEDLTQLIGQDRAGAAMEFAIGIGRDGFNLFVMGPPGSGKHSLVQDFLARQPVGREPPGDWAYVNNFADPHKPIALALPAGRAAALKHDMQQLVDELRTAIPAMFESDEYRARAGQIEADFTERHERAFTELGAEAEKEKVALLRTPAGFSFAPVKDGEVISPEDYAALPDEEKERIARVIKALQQKLEGIIREVMRLRKEQREQLKQLNREMTLFAVGTHMTDLKERYAGLERVHAFLDAVQQDVIDNAEDFVRAREAQSGGMPQQEAPSFRRYQVNVLVEHGTDSGPPVVVEEHPTYQNLVGRVEHIPQYGTLVTDFNLVKPGALHRSNGGYLLIDALKLVTQPFSWEALKRAISTRQIRIESLGEVYGLMSTVSLAPEPIPLEVKVVLFGDRLVYYLLHAYDPDFPKLFKVAADFEDRIDRTPEHDALFARLVATMARGRGLVPFERDAVARVIEHSARLAGDAKKLSANIRAIGDLMSEADHWARQAGRARAGAADVGHAIEAQRKRSDRMRSVMHEAILRGTVLIDSGGEQVGQVNGLSVLQLGDHAFGAPTRITATTRLGDGRVIDVQREVELGGAIHSKGVLILSAFLAARFSFKRPHSLAASLVFEQTYGLVEGDSASLAELCALLSSLAEAPIKQSYAVTGSVNQLGEVQAIGGVNEKIEGFFDVCNAPGLTGGQGVIIPAANVDDLMLRADVIAAARAGRFQVYAVTSVDEAVELLTGVAAGEPDASGGFPAQTINGRVAARMRELSVLRQKLGARDAGRNDRRVRRRG